VEERAAKFNHCFRPSAETVALSAWRSAFPTAHDLRVPSLFESLRTSGIDFSAVWAETTIQQVLDLIQFVPSH
jgi:hypothetical protein